MYKLDYYKSIERPKPEYRINQKVSICPKYGDIITGRVIKIARLWMAVRRDDNQKVEEYHLENCKSRSGDGSRLICPEFEIYAERLEEARETLKKHHIEYQEFKHDQYTREQVIFYLADAVAEFFAEED